MPKKLPQKHSTSIKLSAMVGAQGSSNTIWNMAGGGSGHSISIGGSGLDTITLGGNAQLPQPYVNFSLIKAHGGTIVQCRAENNHDWEYYVIPDSVKNFDRELGKIISMQLLKG